MTVSAAPSVPKVGVGDRPGEVAADQTVEVFGHTVHYAVRGAGDAVLVVCPGSAGAGGSWAKDQLATRLRVIELNPPGWGGTPKLSAKIDQRDLAVLVAAAVEALGIERYHLHGASMGGVTALWLANQFPSRVRTLSLEGDMNFVREEDLVNPAGVRVLADMVARGDPDGEGYPRAEIHPRKPWMDEEHFREQMRKRIPMMQMLTNLHEDELLHRLPEYEVPTIVLLGDRDELLRPTHLDRWRAVHPVVSTVLLRGAAHDVQNTEPEQLVGALTCFHSQLG
jgi:Predicted hydrolases or acyltransferases (alpha/beta hydrolase superfamily)